MTDPEYQVLLETVLGWLKGAVTGTGIGAKTSAGYGWFSIDEEAAEKRKAEAEALAQEEARKAEALRQEQAAQAAEEERVAQLSPLERHIEQIERLEDQQFAGKAKDVIAGKLPEDELRAFFKVLQSSSKKDRRKQWKKKKEAEFWTPLKEAAAKFNIEIS